MSGKSLARTIGRGIAAGRLLYGAAMVLAPEPATRAWLGQGGDGQQAAVRALGIRDLVLGAGALLALRDEDHDAEAERWLEASAVADLGDVAATLTLGRPSGTRALAIGVAASAALSGAFARARLR